MMKYVVLVVLMSSTIAFGMGLPTGNSKYPSAIEHLTKNESLVPEASRDTEWRLEFLRKVASCYPNAAYNHSITQEWINEAIIVYALQGSSAFLLPATSDERMSVFRFLFKRKPDMHYKDDAAFFYFACRFGYTELKAIDNEGVFFRFSTYKRIMEYYQTVFNSPPTTKTTDQVHCLNLITPFFALLNIPISPNTYVAAIVRIISELPIPPKVNVDTIAAKIPTGRTVLYGEIRDRVLAEIYPDLANYFTAEYEDTI